MLLCNPETNLTATLTDAQSDQMHAYLDALIMATDLAIHGMVLTTLKERKKVLMKHAKLGSSVGMAPEDMTTIMCSLMKCSDLSNEIRKQHMSKKWAKLVVEEFLWQSRKERELEMPVTPFMDGHKIIIAKEQINFIEKLCMPLYELLAAIFPNIGACVKQMCDNRDAWQTRLRLFFSDPDEIKKLSNKSIWEREQVKAKGGDLSSTLAMRASNAQVPSSTRRGSIVGTPPVIHNNNAKSDDHHKSEAMKDPKLESSKRDTQEKKP